MIQKDMTENGYDSEGYDREGYDRHDFNREGIHKKTGTKYDRYGYDREGYNSEGYNRNGFNKEGYNKLGYDVRGFDSEGFDKRGCNREGYDREGFDQKGFNKEGFNREGFNKKGIHKETGTQYNPEGYDKDGYDKSGFNKDGIDRTGKNREERAEIKQTQRKNYLGLRDKAKKLATGRLTIEEYIMKSKTSINDLIIFARKEHLSDEIIKGLYKCKKPYEAYSKPFVTEEYLKSHYFVFDGEKVVPTESDVNLCMEYLNANGRLVCYKTVTETLRGYLKGDLDIRQRDGETLEEDTRTELETLEDEQKELQEKLVKVKQLEQEVTEKDENNKRIGE